MADLWQLWAFERGLYLDVLAGKRQLLARFASARLRKALYDAGYQLEGPYGDPLGRYFSVTYVGRRGHVVETGDTPDAR